MALGIFWVALLALAVTLMALSFVFIFVFVFAPELIPQPLARLLECFEQVVRSPGGDHFDQFCPADCGIIAACCPRWRPL